MTETTNKQVIKEKKIQHKLYLSKLQYPATQTTTTQ